MKNAPAHSHSSEQDRPLSVCHIFPALPLHGAENHFLKLTREIDPQKIRTSICLISDGGPLIPDFEALGIPVTLILKKGRYDFSILWRLRRYLRNGQFDIIHTHLFTANFWGRTAALFLPTILVSSAHNVQSREHAFLSRIETFFDRILTRATDAVFCVTPMVMRSMEKETGLPREKLVTIENGIQCPDPSDLPSKPQARLLLDIPMAVPCIAVIGRFSTQKNHRTFLSSLLPVREKFPDLLVLFVGEGEREEEIREETKRLGLEETVRFMGQRRDIPVILRALDALIVPSLWEGLPNVMLEAMAVGTPVIATRVGGIPDVLTDGQTGLLTEPDEKNLTDAMLTGLLEPERMNGMALASLALIKERYDIRQTAGRYTGFYRSLMRKRTFDRGIRDRVRSLLTGILSNPAVSQTSHPLRVLMYHRISDEKGTDILCVTPFQFAEQMRWLKEKGYAVLSLDRAMDGLSTGTLPPRPVLITFDDGYRDNYEKAYPVLLREGLPATIFPVASFVRGETQHPRYEKRKNDIFYLTPEQIGEMAENNIQFGGHTDTHRLMTELSDEETRHEIQHSKKDLEDWTGKPVETFAYPNGNYHPRHFTLLEEAGIRRAFTTEPGINSPSTNPFRLRRTEISGRDSLGDFIRKMEGGFDRLHQLYQQINGTLKS